MKIVQSKLIACGNDRKQSYREAGEGAPLVMLHGIGSSGASFEDQLIGLAANHRVIAWDAPGYNGSTHLAQDSPTASDFAEALMAFVEVLGIARFHLLGHSLGCLMAARFARLYPSRVLSLSLCSIAIGQSHLEASVRNDLLLSRLKDVHELGSRGMAEKRGPRLLAPGAAQDKVRRVVNTMAAVDPIGYSQAARMLSTGNIKADVVALRPDLPVQVIYGDSDVITPPGDNEAVAALIPAARVEPIPDAGHAVYLEKPEAFNKAVQDFLDRSRRVDHA